MPGGGTVVEGNACFIGPGARIDMGAIARQIAWHEAQGFWINAPKCVPWST